MVRGVVHGLLLLPCIMKVMIQYFVSVGDKVEARLLLVVLV